jgi:hypothetical protein
MPENDWFTRQAGRTKQDIKILPDWLRTDRKDEDRDHQQDYRECKDDNRDSQKWSA